MFGFKCHLGNRCKGLTKTKDTLAPQYDGALSKNQLRHLPDTTGEILNFDSDLTFCLIRLTSSDGTLENQQMRS